MFLRVTPSPWLNETEYLFQQLKNSFISLLRISVIVKASTFYTVYKVLSYLLQYLLLQLQLLQSLVANVFSKVLLVLKVTGDRTIVCFFCMFFQRVLLSQLQVLFLFIVGRGDELVNLIFDRIPKQIVYSYNSER